jgi:hypothetical protein
MICEIKPMYREFCQYYVEFHVVATDLDWGLLAVGNALPMGQFEEMKDAYTHSDMLEDLSWSVTVWWDDLCYPTSATQLGRGLSDSSYTEIQG